MMNESLRKMIKEQMDLIKKEATVLNEGAIRAYGFSKGANWMYEVLSKYAQQYKEKQKVVEKDGLQ
jgi:predicted esterase